MQRFLQFFAAIALIGTLAAFPAHAEDTANTPSFYVLIYSPGPAWIQDLPMEKQKVGRHYAYMLSLRDTHRLFLAGPLGDTNGGLILLRAKSAGEAKDIMAHDPAIMAGVFAGEVHGWNAAVDSGKTAAEFLAAPQ